MLPKFNNNAKYFNAGKGSIIVYATGEPKQKKRGGGNLPDKEARKENQVCKKKKLLLEKNITREGQSKYMYNKNK
jgi:hypothetical protein